MGRTLRFHESLADASLKSIDSSVLILDWSSPIFTSSTASNCSHEIDRSECSPLDGGNIMTAQIGIDRPRQLH